MKAKIIITLGIIIILFSPFIPNQVFDYLFYGGWGDYKSSALIPAIRTTGILITIIGLVLLAKKGEMK